MPKFPSGWAQQEPPQIGDIEVVDYYPNKQTPTTWTDKITLEIHHHSNTLPVDVSSSAAR